MGDNRDFMQIPEALHPFRAIAQKNAWSKNCQVWCSEQFRNSYRFLNLRLRRDSEQMSSLKEKSFISQPLKWREKKSNSCFFKKNQNRWILEFIWDFFITIMVTISQHIANTKIAKRRLSENRSSFSKCATFEKRSPQHQHPEKTKKQAKKWVKKKRKL